MSVLCGWLWVPKEEAKLGIIVVLPRIPVKSNDFEAIIDFFGWLPCAITMFPFDNLIVFLVKELHATHTTGVVQSDCDLLDLF